MIVNNPFNVMTERNILNVFICIYMSNVCIYMYLSCLYFAGYDCKIIKPTVYLLYIRTCDMCANKITFHPRPFFSGMSGAAS